MEKETIVVSFSGGKTSAYMCKWLLDNYGHLYHFVFIFANTGCELEETLVFVDKCDKEYGLNVVWVEAVINPQHMKGITHRVTNFKDAYRIHQYKDPKHPFHAHIAKSGIPNANKPQCSDRLKALPIEHYKKVNGLTGVKHAIGMRADEPNRVFPKQKREALNLIGIDADLWRLDDASDRKLMLDSFADEIEVIVNNLELDKDKKAFRSKVKSLHAHNKYNLCYPMADWIEVDKLDVNIYWEMQPFTLNIEEHEGNCATCWKKSDKKIFLLSLEAPWKFEAFRWWEKTYQHIKPNTNGQDRVFFRKNRGVDDIFRQSEVMDEYTLRQMIGYKDDQDSGCSESCEAYLGDELS